MMRSWMVCVLVLGMAGAAWAGDPGTGKARGRQDEGLGEAAQGAAERAAKAAVDAAADALAGEDAPSGANGMPPGLSKQGKTPPGLAKQEKTPPGWDKGKKAGWTEEPKQESFIRKMMRGVFGGGTKAGETLQAE
ncbi:MAG TPA: hypothetical protein VGB20_07305 [bacterium]